MKSLLGSALALIALPALSFAYSWDLDDERPRNSYEQQRHTYEKTGVDTYRNGPLPDLAEERRRQEERQREERQRQERQQSQDRHGYGQPYR